MASFTPMGISSYSLYKPQNLLKRRSERSERSGKPNTEIYNSKYYQEDYHEEHIQNVYQTYNSGVEQKGKSNQIYLEVLMGEIKRLKERIETLEEEKEDEEDED